MAISNGTARGVYPARFKVEVLEAAAKEGAVASKVAYDFGLKTPQILYNWRSQEKAIRKAYARELKTEGKQQGNGVKTAAVTNGKARITERPKLAIKGLSELVEYLLDKRLSAMIDAKLDAAVEKALQKKFGGGEHGG